MITLGILVAVVAAGIFAVTTARTDLSLGPHRAHYAMTSTGLVVVDLGPLGTIELDSPLPLGLGLDARVEEIPEEVTSVGQFNTLEALGSDLNAYIQFFSGPQATVSDVGWALARDAAQRFAIAFGAIVVVGWGTYLVLGRARREELAARGRPHVPVVAGALVLVIVVSTVATSGTNHPRSEQGRTATAVFNGTPLEGARITGRLAGVVDTYGGMVVQTYEDNEQFYALAAQNVTHAWQHRAARTVAESDRLGRLLAPRADAALADQIESSQDEEQATQEATHDDAELVTLLVVSDLHCNIGMAPVIEEAAIRSGADVIINGGDTTMNGSTVEKFCVTTFAGAAPKGVPFVSVTGNHDSVITAADMTDSGMIVLDGGIQEIAGIRMLGAADPNETRIGSGTQSAGPETAQEVAAQLAEVACAQDDPVDLLLIHTHYVGQEALDSGCVNVQVSGHIHRRIGPERIGQGVRYVNGTTAGAVEGELTVGPLRGTAEMTVLRFDLESRTMVDYQLITVKPDASAHVGAPLRFPRPQPLASQE